MALGRAYDLVLVAAPAGLLVPVGDGWTIADLAVALAAPAVVVTGPGSLDHTTLALGALDGRGIPASVVTIGEIDEDTLPVTPAGRIPAAPPDDFAGAADWFDPMLRGTADPPPEPVAAPFADRRPPVSGRRVVLWGLAIIAAVMVAICGTLWAALPEDEAEKGWYLEGGPDVARDWQGGPDGARVWQLPLPPPGPDDPIPSATERTRTADEVFPQNAARVAAARPDAATRAGLAHRASRADRHLAGDRPALRRPLSAMGRQRGRSALGIRLKDG